MVGCSTREVVGSLATQAYSGFRTPVVVEEIKADAGLDIGFTLIGMHLKKVAVPLRLENNRSCGQNPSKIYWRSKGSI